MTSLGLSIAAELTAIFSTPRRSNASSPAGSAGMTSVLLVVLSSVALAEIPTAERRSGYDNMSAANTPVILANDTKPSSSL